MTRQGVVAVTLVVAAFVMSGFGVARAAGDTQQAAAQATGAAQAWLKLVDDGGYKESWEQAASFSKTAFPNQRGKISSAPRANRWARCCRGNSSEGDTRPVCRARPMANTS